MEKIKIKQVKSRIQRPKKHKLILEALGFSKMNQVVEHDDTPSIRGMVEKVKHLVMIVE
ncbi:MAG: 50S ribosomal protein L30 [Massilibacteroides sp.]|nr:50S ribosomal protein L30 [Massilibacteroides sp.]